MRRNIRCPHCRRRVRRRNYERHIANRHPSVIDELPPAPSDSPDTPPGIPERPGPTSWRCPEGALIKIDSAGPWTLDALHRMLVENGLDSVVGPHLTVKVQDKYASQAATAAGESGGVYTSFNATMYLKGINSGFSNQPDAVVGHEYGHVWSLYHLYLSQNGKWDAYLDFRELTGHLKLDTSYEWSRAEIIAEDYRLIFGSTAAIAQRPQHMNQEIPDPRKAELRDFLRDEWRAA